jgi:hypothetical protein
MLIELLLAGFFAVACFRAQVRTESGPYKSLLDFFRLPGRIDRLRRTRWQWFSMFAFVLVLRLQQQIPPVLELMAALQFALFMAFPKATGSPARAGAQ